MVVLFYPAAFNEILGFAGVLVAFLLGILPALMAWSSRYTGVKFFHKNLVFGGKGVLIAVVLFFSYIMYLELNSIIFSGL